MAVTENIYTGNGLTVFYSFTFPYLETTDVKVSLNGVDTTAYTLANATTVQLNTPPASGTTIRIYRDTNADELSATFYPGSSIRAQDLNDNFTQNLYVTQEINNNSILSDGSNPMAGDLDMGGFKVVNASRPLASSDLATKEYVDSYAIVDPTTPAITYWRIEAVESQLTLSGTDSSGVVLDYTPSREQVYVNGVLQQRGVDYNAVLENQITFVYPLKAGDIVTVIALNYLTGRDGPQGPIGLTGNDGPPGPQGDPGIGIQLKGSIAPSVGPPGFNGTNPGDVYIDNNGDGWAWDGTTWTNVGPIQGPQGPAGDVSSIALGSVTAPSIAFTGDSNTGIYSPGANQVAITTDGTNRFVVTSGGNVGIGTASPVARLDVATSGDSSIVLANETTYTDGLKRGRITKKTNNSFVIQACDSASPAETVFLRTISAESARIDSSGRFLVGTSSALGGNNATVQIAGNTSSAGLQITRFNTSDGCIVDLSSNKNATVNSYTISDNGDELARLRFLGYDGANQLVAAQITAYVDGTPGLNDMPGRLVFSTTADGASSPTERMRIDNTGKAIFTGTIDHNNPRYRFVATTGQTVFNASHVTGQERVFLNGSRLDWTTDYTANGSTITLTTGATAGDVLLVESI